MNEETGDIVQVTENGYMGMLCNAHKSMKLFIMRSPGGGAGRGGASSPATPPNAAAAAPGTPAASTPPAAAAGPRGGRGNGGQQIIEIDLARLFADSAAGAMKAASTYERLCGTVPPGINAGGNMGLDANDDFMYFSVTGPDTAQLSQGQTLQEPYGPRGMGRGPSGLRSMNLKTGEVKVVCNVGFQIGHVQTNPVVPGEIIFCSGDRRQGAAVHVVRQRRRHRPAALDPERLTSGSPTKRPSTRTKWRSPSSATAGPG